MAGVYRPRYLERTVLYRVLFHHFNSFVTEYESRFEKEYGFLRPIVKEVVGRYLDCGNPRCGFACIRCHDCGEERLLMFSCRTRGLCPSCHAKRIEAWGEWMREALLLDIPHRQVVFTMPKMLRIFFKYNRALLEALCRAAVQALMIYFHPHLHFLVTEGGEDSKGLFHHLAEFDDRVLAEFFKQEVFSLLMGKGLISEELVRRLSGWRHSGFSVHSKVRAETKKEAERVGKYMNRPVLSLDKLFFSERGGEVDCRLGEGEVEKKNPSAAEAGDLPPINVPYLEREFRPKKPGVSGFLCKPLYQPHTSLVNRF